MKILFVTSIPRSGSIGSIITILKEGLLKKGHQVRICYGYYKDDINDDIYKKITKNLEFRTSAFFSRLSGYECIFTGKSTSRLIDEIENFSPDVVNLTNLHSYYVNEYVLFDYLKKKNIPTVYTMFDAYAYTGKCPFPYNCRRYMDNCGQCPSLKDYPSSLIFDRSSYILANKEKAYSGFNNLTFVGGIGIINTARESRLLTGKRLELIDEPQDFDDIYYPRSTDALREELNIPQENVVVIGAMPLSVPRKAGYNFLRLCERMKGIPGYSFVYIGFDTEEYGRPDNLITIPFVNSLDKLASYLSLGDIMFFTSKADTTSCVILDALACGTPVIGFDIDGNNFNFSNQAVFTKVPIEDIDAVVNVVLNTQKKTPILINECRESVYGTFNKTAVVDKYINLYNNIITQ